MGETRNPLVDSGVLLAAGTAYLYCVSTAEYGGFLRVLHLDADVLDRNFNQTLYDGFLLCFVPAFYVLAGWALCSWLYSHMFYPSAVRWLRQGIAKRRKFAKLKQWLLGKGKDSPSERRLKRGTVRVFIYVFVALVGIVFLARFEAKGKYRGLELMRSIESGAVAASSHVVVRLEDQTRRLVYITCGARNCAAVDPASKLVYYFPQNGHAYQLPVPALQSAAGKATR